jgi:hypothetical protein
MSIPVQPPHPNLAPASPAGGADLPAKRPLPRWLSRTLLAVILSFVLTLPLAAIALIIAQVAHPGRTGLVLWWNKLWIFWLIALAVVVWRLAFPRPAGEPTAG